MILTKTESKKHARELEPVVRIGKNGLTDGMIAEIKRQVAKKRVIKVKMLRAFLAEKNRKEAASSVAAETGCELVSLIGNILVLRKA